VYGKVTSFEVAPVPSAAGFRRWKNLLFTQVAANSGRSLDETSNWLRAVDDPRITIEDLADSQGFDQLDARLLASLVSACNNTVIGNQIERAQITSLRRRIHLKGRQALFIICDYFKVEENNGQMLGLVDLISVQLTDDSKLESFYGELGQRDLQHG